MKEEGGKDGGGAVQVGHSPERSLPNLVELLVSCEVPASPEWPVLWDMEVLPRLRAAVRSKQRQSRRQGEADPRRDGGRIVTGGRDDEGGGGGERSSIACIREPVRVWDAKAREVGWVGGDTGRA